MCVDSYLVLFRTKEKCGPVFEVADFFVLRILHMIVFYTFHRQSVFM